MIGRRPLRVDEPAGRDQGGGVGAGDQRESDADPAGAAVQRLDTKSGTRVLRTPMAAQLSARFAARAAR